MDHGKWRYHRKSEESPNVNLQLFPRVCDKLRDDPVRLIVTESAPRERSSTETNMVLLPRAKEAEKTNSLFVERRRYAR